MRLNRYSKKARLWITLSTGVILSISLAVSSAVSASPASESQINFLSLADAALVAEKSDFHSTALSTEREMARSGKAEVDSVVCLLLPNDKGKHYNDDDQGNWDNDRNNYDHDGKRTGSVSVQVVFGDRDRRIIREYCSRPNSNLPPGLAKRGGHLPPGLEKQLRRNGTLPPGLQKKVERFPVELERCLPPLPRNYARVFVGGRGLIVDAQFNILDVIEIFR